MRTKLTCLCLVAILTTSCGALTCLLSKSKDDISFQVPIMVWSNSYVVTQSVRTSGIFCPWPETKCNVLMADAQYEITTGRWTNAALVEIREPGKVYTESRLERYDVNKDQCLTNPDLRDLECSPNYELHNFRTPNDPLYREIEPNMRQIRAKKWLNRPHNPGPIVAVIDTGIMGTHQDLTGQVVGCYDAVTDREGLCEDNNGHGTHVAGTIAAIVNNRAGITGVAPTSKLLAIKFLSANGSGSLFDAIKGIDWAISHKARIINASWGGGGYSAPLKSAIERARNAGILFIGAAGNEGSDGDLYPHYPSNFDVDNVVAVAAVDSKDKLAPFSNFGAQSVDLSAPGVGILSTKAGGGYVELSGTSMATPHVAGVAAAILTKFPGAGYKEVIQRLKRVRVRKNLKNKTAWGGVVNLANALRKQP